MGTRHLIEVISNGERKVSQYGQWDGYPTGQGVRVLGFLKKMNKTHFIKQLDKLEFVNDEVIDNMYTELRIQRMNGFISMDDAGKFGKKHPQLNRDTGAGILTIINDYKLKRKKLPMGNAHSFADDKLFCEFKYVINFDDNTFEAFGCDGMLIGSFNLRKLPTIKNFVKELETKNDKLMNEKYGD